MISSLIDRKIKNTNKKLNIIYTKCDNRFFKHFIEQNISGSLLDFEDTYYGYFSPHVILCNNRILYLDKCLDLAKFFHIPLIIIDHEVKPKIVLEDINYSFDIYPVIQIALSQDIYDSWNKPHDYILSITESDIENWKSILHDTAYEIFKVKE